MIYVSRIMTNLPKYILVSQFADNIAIYCKISSFIRCKKLIKKTTTIIGHNHLNLGLELCPQKTTILHFYKKSTTLGQTEIKIAEYIIKSCNTARFLGIIFDYKMTFLPHVNHIKKKCMRALNIGTW